MRFVFSTLLVLTLCSFAVSEEVSETPDPAQSLVIDDNGLDLAINLFDNKRCGKCKSFRLNLNLNKNIEDGEESKPCSISSQIKGCGFSSSGSLLDRLFSRFNFRLFRN